MNQPSIILFDGVCNLCNGFVNFLIPRDKDNQFIFSSLQSDKAHELLKELNYSSEKISSVLLIENGNLFSRSAAVLRIFRKMRGLWPVLYIFILVPGFLRDPLYDLIARNRYRLFGKKESCMIPTAELKTRFIQ